MISELERLLAVSFDIFVDVAGRRGRECFPHDMSEHALLRILRPNSERELLLVALLIFEWISAILNHLLTQFFIDL